VYLFRLYNGTPAERQRYDAIHSEFKALTGSDFRVEMRVRRQGVGAQASVTKQAVVVTDSGVQIEYAGSGRRQALLMACLLAEPEHRVLLMDEPSAHLHPFLQTQLARRLQGCGAQSIVVAHSGDMVPRFGLLAVRRVVLSPLGTSQIMSPDWNKESEDGVDPRRWPRSSKDIAFLFARVVAFVEGDNEEAAFPAWFNRMYGDGEAHRLGVHFHPVAKTGIAPWLVCAEAFGIPSLGVYDSDVLKAPAAEGKNARSERKQNEGVIGAWKKHGWIDSGLCISLGDETWVERLPEVSNNKLFCVGLGCEGRFETLPEFSASIMNDAKRAVGPGPRRYQWIADHQCVKCPPQIARILRAVHALALK
jgi:hypothetical protein